MVPTLREDERMLVAHPRALGQARVRRGWLNFPALSRLKCPCHRHPVAFFLGGNEGCGVGLWNKGVLGAPRVVLGGALGRGKAAGRQEVAGQGQRQEQGQGQGQTQTQTPQAQPLLPRGDKGSSSAESSRNQKHEEKPKRLYHQREGFFLLP